MRTQFDILNLFFKIMNKRRALYLCLIFVLISGIAQGADRDVIIVFHESAGQSEQALIHSHGGIAKRSFHLIPAIATRIPEDEIDELKKDPRIAYIEDDMIFKAADEYTSSWGVTHIGSKTVHDKGINGTGVKVAVLDTGIDYDHEDLKGNYKGGYDYVFNDADPADDNTYSHGTHVTGIISAKDNGIGVIGVAPNADIYAVKVLDGAGFGLESWIISGIQWAVDNDMDIVTMSIEGQDSQALHDAADKAYNSGVLLIAAGGNTNGGSVRYPGAYDSVIAVSATDENNQRGAFSATGPEIELAAPGVNVLSTVRGGYNNISGTSMAAPHVAGVAALVFSSGFNDVNMDGITDNKDVRSILQDTARDLGDPGRDNIYGYGLVDAQRAVQGIIDIELLIKKTNSRQDKQKISLSAGNYSITIRNNNLSRLEIDVFENGIIRKDISYKFKLNNSKEINIYVDVRNVFDIVFIPYGNKGSSGYVTVRGVL